MSVIDLVVSGLDAYPKRLGVVPCAAEHGHFHGTAKITVEVS